MIEVEGSALYINLGRKDVSEIAAKGGGRHSSLPHPAQNAPAETQRSKSISQQTEQKMRGGRNFSPTSDFELIPHVEFMLRFTLAFPKQVLVSSIS